MSESMSKQRKNILLLVAAFMLVDLVILAVLWQAGIFGNSEPATEEPDEAPPAVEAPPVVEPAPVVDWREAWEQIKQIEYADERLSQYIALRDGLEYFSKDQTELLRLAMMHFNGMDQIDFRAGRFTDPQRRTYIKLFDPTPTTDNVNQQVHDISALTGMNVQYLKLQPPLPNLSDYSPLATMQVEDLWLVGNTNFIDITLINHMDGLIRAHLSKCGFADIRGLDLKADLHLLHLGVNSKLTSLEGIQGTKVRHLRLNSCDHLADISAITEVDGLESLDLGNSGVYDLRPLAGVKTQRLTLGGCRAIRPRSAADYQRNREILEAIGGEQSFRRWRDWVEHTLPNTKVTY